MKHLLKFNESANENIGLIEDVFINLTDEFDNIEVSVKLSNNTIFRERSYYTIISFDAKSRRIILPKINSCYDIIESYGFEKIKLNSLDVGTSIAIFYIPK